MEAITLKDFLKDKTLPVTLQAYPNGYIYRLVYFHNGTYYGHYECYGMAVSFKDNCKGNWQLHVEPEKVINLKKFIFSGCIIDEEIEARWTNCRFRK
jgi:hypothetical protein